MAMQGAGMPVRMRGANALCECVETVQPLDVEGAPSPCPRQRWVWSCSSVQSKGEARVRDFVESVCEGTGTLTLTAVGDVAGAQAAASRPAAPVAN